MKICFYINTISRGGAERVVANLANYLVGKHQVTLINSFKYSDDEYELDNRIVHLYMDNNHFRSRLHKNLYRIKYLKKYIKNERPDVVISFMAEPNFRLIAASRRVKTKAIISVRNDPYREYSGFINRFLARHYLTKADGCVFQTKDAMSFFPSKFQQKSKVILNSVSQSFFDAEFNGSRKNIVTCGRLTKQKNHEFLLKCFANVKDLTDDNLIIFGTGSLKPYLQSLCENYGISDRVVFGGQITDVINAIKSAKIFVLSSNFEGMPNALMEAMALGVPCISTDCPCGGPRSIIDNGKNGLLVPVGNQEQMINALKKLLLNEKLQDSFSVKGRKNAYSLFNSKKINEEWEKYILEVLNRK